MTEFGDPLKTDTVSAVQSEESMRFLGRQPILDINGCVFGYELLFRAGTENTFTGDAEHATRDVIDHYIQLMPEQHGEFSFVNCTRSALMTRIVTLLPAASVVLEILEDIEPDAELMECCRELKTMGYRFALDDFSPDESKLAFLEIADFIKVDFRMSDAPTRKTIYTLAAQVNATILAEKVETWQDMQIAKAEGCRLFQGYYFSKPVVVATRAIPQNHLVYLQLLSVLSKTTLNLLEAEALVMQDASLCYRLLRLVNSALYGLPTHVTSIRNAITMVGDNEFRKMVTVALAGTFSCSASKALIQMALERAKFCELLAPLVKQPASRLYLLGMLSVIDVILSIPMKEIVAALPVDGEMKAALMGEESPLTVALRLACSHESGNWRKCMCIQTDLGVTGNAVSTIYIESVQWADKMATLP